MRKNIVTVLRVLLWPNRLSRVTIQLKSFERSKFKPMRYLRHKPVNQAVHSVGVDKSVAPLVCVRRRQWSNGEEMSTETIKLRIRTNHSSCQYCSTDMCESWALTADLWKDEFKP